MDHLPEVIDPAFEPFEVPCLCQVADYTPRGFLDFPLHHGWTIDYEKGLVRADQASRVLRSSMRLHRHGCSLVYSTKCFP